MSWATVEASTATKRRDHYDEQRHLSDAVVQVLTFRMSFSGYIFFFSLLYCALSVLALSLVELTCAQHSNKYFNSRGMTSNKCQHVRVTGDTTQQNWWKDARYVFIFFFLLFARLEHRLLRQRSSPFRKFIKWAHRCQRFLSLLLFLFRLTESSWFNDSNKRRRPTDGNCQGEKRNEDSKMKSFSERKKWNYFFVACVNVLVSNTNKTERNKYKFSSKKKIIIKTKSFFSVISAWIT